MQEQQGLLKREQLSPEGSCLGLKPYPTALTEPIGFGQNLASTTKGDRRKLSLQSARNTGADHSIQCVQIFSGLSWYG